MPVKWELEDGNLGVFHISAMLKVSEMKLAQDECEQVINKVGHIKILIILNEFTGWDDSENWDDTSFSDRNDKFIDKMAIVGDKKWQDSANLFTLKDFRSVPIEFFDATQGAEARKWLGEME